MHLPNMFPFPPPTVRCIPAPSTWCVRVPGAYVQLFLNRSGSRVNMSKYRRMPSTPGAFCIKCRNITKPHLSSSCHDRKAVSAGEHWLQNQTGGRHGSSYPEPIAALFPMPPPASSSGRHIVIATIHVPNKKKRMTKSRLGVTRLATVKTLVAVFHIN